MRVYVWQLVWYMFLLHLPSCSKIVSQTFRIIKRCLLLGTRIQDCRLQFHFVHFPIQPTTPAILTVSVWNTMASKFVEIMDTADQPYSHDNVSLEDILEDTRHRSQSTGESSSPRSSTSISPTRERSATINYPTKPRLRGLTLKKPKS